MRVTASGFVPFFAVLCENGCDGCIALPTEFCNDTQVRFANLLQGKVSICRVVLHPYLYVSLSKGGSFL